MSACTLIAIVGFAKVALASGCLGASLALLVPSLRKRAAKRRAALVSLTA
jgi:hypothetical protein